MTIQLFNSILTMTTSLKLSTDIHAIIPKHNFFNTPIYSNNNYIVKHNNYNTRFRNSIEYHNIKCWKSKCISNYYIDNDNEDNTIFSLDFNINKDDINNHFIKIDYLEINNDFYDNKYTHYYDKTYRIRNIIINDEENKLIRRSLINFIENWAIKENISKIIIDIHSNLERYNYELKDEGFIPTDKKCLLNPYWIEAEKIIKSI